MRFRKMGFPFFQNRISHFQKTDMRFTDYVFLLLLSKAYNSPPRLGDRRGTLLESQKQWDERHANWLFTGLCAYQCGEYDLALDLIGTAMKLQEVVQAYGWLGHCYLSAIYTKLGNEDLAEKAKEAAKKIKAEGVDEFIEKLKDINT